MHTCETNPFGRDARRFMDTRSSVSPNQPSHSTPVCFATKKMTAGTTKQASNPLDYFVHEWFVVWLKKNTNSHSYLMLRRL